MKKEDLETALILAVKKTIRAKSGFIIIANWDTQEVENAYCGVCKEELIHDIAEIINHADEDGFLEPHEDIKRLIKGKING